MQVSAPLTKPLWLGVQTQTVLGYGKFAQQRHKGFVSGATSNHAGVWPSISSTTLAMRSASGQASLINQVYSAARAGPMTSSG